MREVGSGVWHWQARHPAWTPEKQADGWGPEVSCYAIDDGVRLLLFDPLAPPAEIDGLAAGREPVVVLTCAWHERDARRVAERLGAKVFMPPPEDGQELAAEVFEAGDRLPIGIEAFPGMDPSDLVLWVESARAVVAGDSLIDRGGLEIPADWLPSPAAREQLAAGLRPLLDRPVELVLPTHGEPTDRAALEHALA